MSDALLALLLSLHAGPLRAEALGQATMNPGVLPSSYAGRLTLELPIGVIRPYLSSTATHRDGSSDLADVSFSAGLTAGGDQRRVMIGWVGTDLEEMFGPPTDGGARGAFMALVTLGRL